MRYDMIIARPWTSSGRALGWAEGSKQRPVDAAESTIRHQHNQVAGPVLRDDGGDDALDRLGGARRHTAALHIGDQLSNREALALGQRRSKHGRDDDFVRRGEGAGEIVLEHATARGGGTRLEDGPDSRLRVCRPQTGKRLGDRRRMMREIVVNRDAVGDADDLQPPLDAGEGAQAAGDPLRADADLGGDGNRGGLIPHVVGADERHLEDTERGAAAPDLESRRCTGSLEIVRLPVGVLARAERLHARDGFGGQRACAGAVGADQQEPATRHQVHEPPERERHRVEVGVDVGVIEFDVADARDVREIFQELGGLVEKGAVVFVAFDDEVATMADPIAGSLLTKVARDAADQHAGIGAAVRQQPARQRRRGRLPVRAGENNRTGAPEKMFADRLGQRAIADLSVQRLLELGVAARNRVADDDQVEITGDVLRLISDERANPFRGEEVAHRRVHVLVRSLDVVPFPLQHRGERGHRRAAYADQMNRAHWTADSSMTRRGLSPAMMRAVTPNGSVIAGPTVWPDGNPISTGPGKSANRSAITARAVGSPDGSSHRGSSPITTPDARAKRPLCTSCVTMRSRRYGRSPTSSRNSRWPAGGSNANGVASEASSCVSVPPSRIP